MNDILFNFVDRPPPVDHSWPRDSFRRRSRIRERNFNERRRGGKRKNNFLKILISDLSWSAVKKLQKSQKLFWTVTSFCAIILVSCKPNRDRLLFFQWDEDRLHRKGILSSLRPRSPVRFISPLPQRELSSTKVVRAPSFLSRSLTHPSPTTSRRTRSIFSWKCPVTRYAAKKRGKRGERKREYGKRKEKRKIKAGSHERLTRRAYTKGREMYRRVERKGTKKREEERKVEGKKKRWKEGIQRFPAAVYRKRVMWRWRRTFIGCSFF